MLKARDFNGFGPSLAAVGLIHIHSVTRPVPNRQVPCGRRQPLSNSFRRGPVKARLGLMPLVAVAVSSKACAVRFPCSVGFITPASWKRVVNLPPGTADIAFGAPGTDFRYCSLYRTMREIFVPRNFKGKTLARVGARKSVSLPEIIGRKSQTKRRRSMRFGVAARHLPNTWSA